MSETNVITSYPNLTVQAQSLILDGLIAADWLEPSTCEALTTIAMRALTPLLAEVELNTLPLMKDSKILPTKALQTVATKAQVEEALALATRVDTYTVVSETADGLNLWGGNYPDHWAEMYKTQVSIQALQDHALKLKEAANVLLAEANRLSNKNVK